MQNGFLPYNYERTLYNKLQNLRQGTSSVEDYATDFFYMSARMSSTESEEQLISRFIGGLRSQLQVALQQFNPTSVSKAHQRALAMETQLRSSWTSSSSRNYFSSITAMESNVEQSFEITKIETNAEGIALSRPSRTNTLRCFACGE